MPRSMLDDIDEFLSTLSEAEVQATLTQCLKELTIAQVAEALREIFDGPHEAGELIEALAEALPTEGEKEDA